MSDDKRNADAERVAAIRALHATLSKEPEPDNGHGEYEWLEDVGLLLHMLGLAEARAAELERRIVELRDRADKAESSVLEVGKDRDEWRWEALDLKDRAEAAERERDAARAERDEAYAELKRLSPDAPVPREHHHRVAKSRRAWIDAATSVLGDDWNGTPDDLRAALDALRTRLAIAEKVVEAARAYRRTVDMYAGDDFVQAERREPRIALDDALGALDANAGGGT